MGFLEDVKAAREQPKPKSPPVEVLVNGNVYSLVFERADGDVWAECVSRHPARGDSPIDKRYGYNFNSVILEIAPKTGSLEDGSEIPDEAWAELFPVLAGADVERITDAVWALNEWDPAQEIARAKKASAAGSRSRKKSS